MAKKISDELIGLKIVINGDEAQAEITKLTDRNRTLNESLNEQKKLLDNLKKANEGQKDALDRITQSLEKYNQKIEHNNILAKQEIESIRIKQRAFAEGSSEYIRYQKQIEKINEKTEKENRKIALSISEIEKKQALLSAEYARSEKNIKTYTKSVENLSEQISNNKSKIDELTQGMNINSLTMDQLRKRASDLRYALNNMNPNSGEFMKTQEDLASVNGRMADLRTGSQAASSSIGNLADKFNRYSGMATAAIATFAGVAVSIQSTIDMNNKLADAQSAVAKTTGLTKAEIKDLMIAFSDFDTRTSNIDLLKISEIGGRLGVPKEEIINFTREIDKAYVALGDSFSGGVEAVAEQLGKIKGLYADTKNLDMATAISQIGSAMNDLGASGAASEENIADFAKRVGAMPEKLKPTVAEALALGAAFEEGGIDAERSATAYGNFMKSASSNSKKFAEVMRISQAEVEKMINTDPAHFFLTFSEGLKGMDGTDLAKILEHLKINDTYVTSIVSNAAENTDRYRKSIDQSNQSLLEATSLHKEFNEVNNNAAGIYDKVKKKFVGMLSSETVANTLNWLISSFGKFIGTVEDADGTITGFRNTLLFLIKLTAIGVTAFYSYNAAVYLNTQLFTVAKAQMLGYTVAQKAHIAWTKVSTGAITLWNTAIGLGALLISKLAMVTGAQTLATNMQTLAQKRLNTAMALNPFGAVIALVVVLTSAYLLFADSVDTATSKQKVMNDLQKESATSVSKEKSELDTLLTIARNKALTDDQRLKAIKRLNEISPEYLGKLTLENIHTKEATKSINQYINALDRKAMAQAMQTKKEELIKKQIELRSKNAADYDPSFIGKGGRMIEDVVNNKVLRMKMHTDVNFNEYVKLSAEEQTQYYRNSLPQVREAIRQWVKDFKGTQNELKVLNEQQINFYKKNPHLLPGENDSSIDLGDYKTDFPTSNSSGDKGETEAERIFKQQKSKYLEEYKRFNEIKTQMQFEDTELTIALMQEGFDKELEILKLEKDKQIEALNKRKHSKVEINELDEVIKKAKDGEKKKLEELKTEWLHQNTELEKFKEQKIKIFALKEKTLREKYALQEVKDEEKKYNKELERKKIEENEKIASLESVAQQKAFLQDKISKKELDKITKWEEGKKKIKEYYAEESLKLQQEHLSSLIEKMNEIPEIKLTEEQLEYLEKLREKLAQIGVELTSIKNGKKEGEKENVDFSALDSLSGKTDILGMSPEQWELLFTNADKTEDKIRKIGAAIHIMKNMMVAYHQFAKANQEAELKRYEAAHERKKIALQRQLDAGIISQQQFKHETEAMNNEMEMKKWKLEYDNARREKDMKKAEIISSTALAVMKVWEKHAANPILASILSAAAIAMGGVQFATVQKQPLPEPPKISGAEDGYYPVLRKQDGKLFNAKKKESTSGIYNEPTILVGEQGRNFPELVVSGKAMKRIDPKLKKEFMQEVYRAEGFENGLYPTPQNNIEKDEMMIKLISLLERNNAFLENLERTGVRGVFEKTARTGKVLEEMQKEYRRLVEKNKH
ncbi:phage tail tape measure protein [Bergeyella zoohelcum]|uniref:Phage tail tape measure protein, TP901 family, core region n=1 Tax=Bergeyella zoohelcum TaxID=1015 RepID=A0A380ZYI5_9FLAO|nr:phage tail tape measure protein [Bergeyella zoohelcum]SUV52590.1 phage tail tape measure protein, TP901 family, core region [Bergeyella zoohelcum]